MIRQIARVFLLMLVFCTAALSAAPNTGEGMLRMQWTVDGVVREALVSIPSEARSRPVPLIFVFHGHGGTMTNAYRRFGIQRLWPEAMVVYPQGIKTPGKLTDPEGEKSGWQSDTGQLNDRDLRFFDAMLASLKEKFKIDEHRIYASGHSNGGLFTYLLWATRGDVLAAVAPSGAAALRLTGLLSPKPALHILGEKDALVKPVLQELTCKAVLKINTCNPNGERKGNFSTVYHSKSGNPLIVYRHPGGHELPDEAGRVISDFFKQQRK